jgi:hypothetical protein
MGKPDKPRRGNKPKPRAKAKGKPKYSAAGSDVGRLSPDIISTCYGPELIARANDVLARYTQELLEYGDALKEYELQQVEAEVGEDGTVKMTLEAPVPPKAPLFRSQFWVKQLEETLADTSEYFQGNDREWKIQAKAARFERRMAEKYGIFLPLLKEYPEVEQLVRSVQRKYSQGHFSPFRQGKAPIPKSTAVIILFMMHRGKVSWQITLLATLFFLIGLQPWALVVLVAGAHTFLESSKRRPRKPMANRIPVVKPYYMAKLGDEAMSEEAKQEVKNDILRRSVGQKLGDKEEIDGSEYDTILLGHGPAALYTAALLSRSGRKVLVLSSKADASGCYTFENPPENVIKDIGSVPFDVDGANTAKVSRQQQMLAPALATSKDPQGGVRFAKIGSAADGYAFEILSVPGMGGGDNGNGGLFVVRADGTPSLMEEAAMSLGDGWPGMKGDYGSSTTGIYAATCTAINSSSNQFYLEKLLSDAVNKMRNASTYQETAIRYASAFLDKGFPVNPHTRSLMAAIGMKSENIKPSMTSMGAHVTNVCATLSGEGMHYPIGGPRALCHALAAVIEQNDGRIVTQVPISSLVFEEGTLPKRQVSGAKENTEDLTPPRCIGVRFADGRQVTVNPTKWKTHDPAIVSMLGLVSTFIRLLPEDIRVMYKVPRGLPALTEQRPVFKIMFALDGNAGDLELPGADFYRLPGAALAQDEMDPVTGQVKPGEIGWIDDKETNDPEVIVEEVNKDVTDNPQESLMPGTRGKASISKKHRNKFEAGASYIHVAFPSAKDPSFESRHGRVSTCVVTIEADDDFVTFFDTKPKLYVVQKEKENSGDLLRLVERVRKDLFEIFPHIRGKVIHSELRGPLYRGLSHNPERYAAKGVRPATPYPGLYVGGSDLTVDSSNGAFIGGWLAANAVMQYTWMDILFLQKNVTSDIVQHLEPPDVLDDEDLAVPPFSIKTSSSNLDD